MSEITQPGDVARRVVLRRVFSVSAGGVVAALALRAGHAKDGTAIAIDNFAFVPAVLQVTVGATVTWTNHDDIPHSVVCPALGVHSPPMDTDASFSLVFSKPGTFTYVCGLHPFMHGQVVVGG